MGLLLLNAFKGLKKKKIQMLSIVLLVTLATGIYIAMNTSLDRLEDEYYNYIDKQNTEHISFEVALDLKSDVTTNDLDKFKDKFESLTMEEQKIIDYYYELLKYNKTDLIDYNYKELIISILSKTGVTRDIERKKLDKLKEEYDFEYEYQEAKTLQINEINTKVMPYLKDKKINIPYLVEGSFPTKENEITMLPAFARINKIKINDEYKIDDKIYKVVGYAYAPDYIYPMVSYSQPIFDEKKNNIIFMYRDDYDKIVGILDNTYSLTYNGDFSRVFEISVGNEEDKIENKRMEMFDKGQVFLSANSVVRMARIGALQLEFVTNRNFSTYFLYLLLGISIFIILIITKKRVENERLQIGVLKALGYNRYSIALSYLIYPILGSVIGGLLGFVIGYLFNEPITSMYMSYYNVPLSNYHIDLSYLKLSILTPLVMLSILSYIIAIIMLNKKPLKLLKEGSNLKVNILSKLVNKLTKPLPFDYRFKYSLASRSLGKLIIVSLTSFATGLLLVLIIIGFNLFNKVLSATFDGIKYKNLVILNSLYYNDNMSDNEDLILNVDGVIKTAKRNQENLSVKKDKKEVEISLSGIDNKVNFFDVLNTNEDIITSSLKDSDGIIINRNLSEQLGYQIGDELEIDIYGKLIKYKIIDISSENMQYIGYVNRIDISKKLNLQGIAYNQVYSNDKKYDNLNKLDEVEKDKIAYILNTHELRDNIMKKMDNFNYTIYIIIFFASFIAFIIIAVIANIIVEENKKTISLLKVMGYKDRKISSIILNIYTPFVIVSYLLAIPVMINLLKWIVSLLVADMNMTIPITLSFSEALIGLIGLLIAYYIAVFLSKKVLYKVPLAVALKRE